MSEIIQLYLINALQVILSFTLINVWLLRFNKTTNYRGKGAKNMPSEFAAYGLPIWFMYFVGTLKILIALALLIGLWNPVLVYPAAAVLVVLMMGAIMMHIKVKDRLIKMSPAIIVCIMALVIIFLQ